MSRNQRSNTMKMVMAKCNHDVLYIIYVVFAKKALSSVLYVALQHMGLVKDYRAYKRLLNDLEEAGLIKRRPIEVFDKYSRDEDIILKQFAIDYMAKSLGESPVAVSQTRTTTATMQRAAKALYLLNTRGDLLKKNGMSYWDKLHQTTTFFIAPNKTVEWLDWFGTFIPRFSVNLPKIEQNFGNVRVNHTNETKKFAENLLIGSKSNSNKGLKANASPMLEANVAVKSLVVQEHVRKRTKENLLDDVSLHKVLNNHIYLVTKRAVNVNSTGRLLSPFGFGVGIIDVRDDATLRTYLLKLAYLYNYITQVLLLDEYDIPFVVDFVVMESHQAGNLQEALNNLRPNELERYGLMLPFENGNVRINIKCLNLRESLQKK